MIHKKISLSNAICNFRKKCKKENVTKRKIIKNIFSLKYCHTTTVNLNLHALHAENIQKYPKYSCIISASFRKPFIINNIEKVKSK